MSEEASLHLVVRRRIRATPQRLFDAWTDPAALVKWWGPADITCPEAEVDLRVGGAYRIANRNAEGDVIWIAGEFEEVSPPERLVYTWRLGAEETSQRVTVRFEARGDATEAIVVHERIPSVAAKESHERGWIGCLDGLVALMEG